MPSGTTQDSRDPNSPQWGYLKIGEDVTNITLDEHIYKECKGTECEGYHARFEMPEPGDWPLIFDPAWNEYIMFYHNKQRDGKLRRLVKGTDVKFKMKKATVVLDNPEEGEAKEFKIWVARVEEVTCDTKSAGVY